MLYVAVTEDKVLAPLFKIFRKRCDQTILYPCQFLTIPCQTLPVCQKYPKSHRKVSRKNIYFCFDLHIFLVFKRLWSVNTHQVSSRNCCSIKLKFVSVIFFIEKKIILKNSAWLGIFCVLPCGHFLALDLKIKYVKKTIYRPVCKLFSSDVINLKFCTYFIYIIARLWIKKVWYS